MTYVIKLKRTTKSFDGDEGAVLNNANLAYGEAVFLDKYGYMVVGKSSGTTTVGNATRVFKAIPKSMADNGIYYTNYDSTNKFIDIQLLQYNNSNYTETVQSVYPRTKFEAVTNAAGNLNLATALDNKMDKNNPTGTGYLSLNRQSNTTVGTSSVAVGSNTTATGSASFAEGSNTTASDSYAHAEGYKTAAQGAGSHAEGYSYESNTNQSYSKQTTASGIGAHAEGRGTLASGNYSHAEGTMSIITADQTTNKQTTASGLGAHAEGCGTEASGDYSHAQGYRSISSAHSTHAEGYQTTAKSDYAHAEGYKTVAGGDASNVGTASHAEGVSTTASGAQAHAEGNATTASGTHSHAEGHSTTASGNYSHAEGNATTASGLNSHAEGLGTIAQGQNQSVSGKYNVADTSNTFAKIIGNGTSSSSKSNAVAIDWNGNLYVKGNIYVNGSSVNATGGSQVFSVDNILNSYEWQCFYTSYTVTKSTNQSLVVYNSSSETSPAYMGISIYYSLNAKSTSSSSSTSFTVNSKTNPLSSSNTIDGTYTCQNEAYGAFNIPNSTVVKIDSDNAQSVFNSIPTNGFFTIHKNSRVLYKKVSGSQYVSDSKTYTGLIKYTITSFVVNDFKRLLSILNSTYPGGTSSSLYPITKSDGLYYIFLGNYGKKHIAEISNDETCYTPQSGNVILLPFFNASILDVSDVCYRDYSVGTSGVGEAGASPSTLVVGGTKSIYFAQARSTADHRLIASLSWRSQTSSLEITGFSGTNLYGSGAKRTLALQNEGKIYVLY